MPTIETIWTELSRKPDGFGWSLFSGNETHNLWWRVISLDRENRTVTLVHNEEWRLT
jgi:hypothetical protein